MDNFIAGKYKHFKGETYDAYCIAKDGMDQKYVLYQQCYGDKSFWIRPYEMFFNKVTIEGKIQDRFCPTTAKRQKSESKISKLIPLIREQKLTIRHSETSEEYCITSINENFDCINVECLTKLGSGYLTEYELLSRMGYICCNINGKLEFFDKKTSIPEPSKLKIGNNDTSKIINQLNPCSIDLQIADSGYLKTKNKIIDPQSIENISRADKLWKKVKVYNSKSQKTTYFKIRPGETVLTHTKEKLKIPYDCAGKIEIKSTYARLSLSISSSDFCNPSYEGYFPFEITNKGNHTVILHQGETMAQLMLIPLYGPILVNYNTKATYKNRHSYDDGTPYTFWRERSIQQLRNEEGTQQIVNAYNDIINDITTSNTKDVNAFKLRFSNTFLAFCQKKIHKEKFRIIDTGLPNCNKIINSFVNHEKFLKRLSSIKFLSTFLSVIGIVLTILGGITLSNKEYILYLMIPALCLVILFIIATIILWIKFPKYFCTLEKMDIEKICEKANR